MSTSKEFLWETVYSEEAHSPHIFISGYMERLPPLKYSPPSHRKWIFGQLLSPWSGFITDPCLDRVGTGGVLSGPVITDEWLFTFTSLLVSSSTNTSENHKINVILIDCGRLVRKTAEVNWKSTKGMLQSIVSTGVKSSPFFLSDLFSNPWVQDICKSHQNQDFPPSRFLSIWLGPCTIHLPVLKTFRFINYPSSA